MIEIFSPLKSFFLLQDPPPIVIKRFSETEMTEIYLWHMRSLMSVLYGHIQTVERAINSVAEVLKIMELVQKVLIERKNENFISLKVKSFLAERQADDTKTSVTIF